MATKPRHGRYVSKSPSMPFLRLFGISSFFLCLASCRPDHSNYQLKEIDNGLRLSIHFIAGQNDAVYSSLQQKLADPSNRYLSNRWSPPAFKVRMLSARAIKYIDSLHSQMSADGSLSKQLEKCLFYTLVKCRRDLLNFFPDSLDPESHYLAEDREMFQRHIPLLFDSSGHAQSGLTFPGWSDNLFQGDTSMIVLSLDKLKIDILLSEQGIVKYCNSQATSTADRFDIFAPLITLNRSIVAPGDSIELTAGIGAYLSSARPNITIAGVSVPSYSGGLAKYSLCASKKPGRYSIPVKIEFTTPYGRRYTVERDVRYRVSKFYRAP